MKITTQDHLQHQWQVHQLLPDFEIEDVWKFPVKLEEHHTLEEFREEFKQVMDGLTQNGFVALLFKLRFFIGGILGWDKEEERVHFKPNSIRERYAKATGLSFEQMPAPGKEEFSPVYALEKEALMEIENATVHAAMHLGKVPDGESYTIQMTVYVKPKGLLGAGYMAVIKPFRLFFVYPALLKVMGKRWANYAQNKVAFQ